MHYLAQIYNPALKSNLGGTKMDAAALLGNFSTFIAQYVGNFVILGFIAGSVVFVGMLIMGGIEYVSAGGDKDKVGSATKRVTNAIIGLVILLFTFVIAQIVQIVFGINILKFDIPTV